MKRPSAFTRSNFSQVDLERLEPAMATDEDVNNPYTRTEKASECIDFAEMRQAIQTTTFQAVSRNIRMYYPILIMGFVRAKFSNLANIRSRTRTALVSVSGKLENLRRRMGSTPPVGYYPRAPLLVRTFAKNQRFQDQVLLMYL